MKVLAFVAVVACSGHEHASAPPAPSPTPSPAPSPATRPTTAAPGLRLPDGATPLSYDIQLELDPDRDAFAGTVAIRVRLDRPSDRVWLHAHELDFVRASYRAGDRAGTLTKVAAANQMIAFSFDRELRGEVTLAFEYTGRVGRANEALFREQANNRWFLYAQSESTFARRILPCFDEPRFKPAWHTTLVVPPKQVALANGAQLTDTVRPDGRHAIAFAEIAAMPSYLFAIAVGPFAIVDAGRVGKNRVPVRVAVPPADKNHVGVVAAKLPAIVDALERYIDRPLPLAKLDVVAVPVFFGAMENVGLVTFETTLLLGDPKQAWVGRRFARFAAHEIAHQWFGNFATPAWWDDLWLAEGFASWIGEDVADQVGGGDEPQLRVALARLHAIAADDDVAARPLRRDLDKVADADERFDAISYDKGGSILEMFERFVGHDAFRDSVRTYVAVGADRAVTADDFLHALAPPARDALAWYLAHPGTPVVEIAADCSGAPKLVVRARAGIVPVCARTDQGRACRIATTTASAIPLTACPKWTIGNADGVGYYHVAVPTAPATITPVERLAYADDVAAATIRGELPAADALATIAQLVKGEPLAQLAALQIVEQLDLLVDDATRPAWTRWVAARFANRLGKAMFAPKSGVERELRDRLAILVNDRIDARIAAAARSVVDKTLATDSVPNDFLLALAAPRGGAAFVDRIVALAAAATADDDRAALLEALGWVGAPLAPRVVELLADRRFKTEHVRVAVAALLARPATRTATWATLRDRLARLALAKADLDALVPVALCVRGAGAEVTRAFPDTAARARAVTSIDRCVTRRASLGDLAAALRP